MSRILRLINKKIKLPFVIGNIFSQVSYAYKPFLGKSYKESTRDIINWETFDEDQKKNFIFQKTKYITGYAFENISFYQEHYKKHSFTPASLKDFSDLDRIPTINKEILKQYDINERSFLHPKRHLVNTGGSSGTPLSFYITPNQIGHEWAHMHHIWGCTGYTYSSLRLSFSGRSNLDSKLYYDFLRHNYLIDIYSNHEDHYSEIYDLFKKKKISFFHGYPSSIYEFVLFLKNHKKLLDLVKKNIQGVIFSSEQLNPSIRKDIEQILEVKTFSFYGHTERSILAGEENPGVYLPLQTYGYTECLENNDDTYNLLGTSYQNYASPLIRYDTGDTVDSIKKNNGILHSFKISQGRQSEFILDENQNKISLTGLIFGRHHEIFNHVKFLQVFQQSSGKAVIFYILKNSFEGDISSLFDKKNISISFTFYELDAPVLTSAGKVTLLLSKSPVDLSQLSIDE